MDDNDLLRVGGRRERGKLSYAKTHPVLLPSGHWVVELLVIYEHVRFLHVGPTAVSASLLRQFCIVRGRRTIYALRLRHVQTHWGKSQTAVIEAFT